MGLLVHLGLTELYTNHILEQVGLLLVSETRTNRPKNFYFDWQLDR